MYSYRVVDTILGGNMQRVLILITMVGLVTAACSSEDSGSTSTSPTTTTAAVQATTTTVATTTTTVPTTTTTTEAPRDIPTTPVVPGADADADEIVELYAIVFDSASTFEEKAPLIEDSTGLEAAVEGYRAAGDGVGGISLDVTQTGVLDDRAAVLFDLLFAENPFQRDQPGDAIRVDGRWVVSRDFFCSIVELARVPCP
jgi:hypothetical protein